jgi:hypothetical protein
LPFCVSPIIYFLFWKIPVWQLENLRADHPNKLYELKATIRGNLIQAFGVIFLVIGIYFAWRRLEVAQEGQITVPFR